MRATVCELPATDDALEDAWEALKAHTARYEADLVLLPEMPFHRWLPASKEVDVSDWEAAVKSHDRWLDRLAELGAGTILGSRPVVLAGSRRNEAFVWTADGYTGARHKYYLPEEEGFWEASWYDRGEKNFPTASSPAGTTGFLVCTELWFSEHARSFGREGAILIANPRATEWSSRDKWLAGGRAAAVVAGAFCLSSNRSGLDPTGIRWGGLGWIVDPDGEVLATTSESEPFTTVEIDPLAAERARVTYPRYVSE